MNKTIKTLLILITINASAVNFCYTQKNDSYRESTPNEKETIMFEDYKLFMIYTRDSIILEILSTQLGDFCLNCMGTDSVKQLNWKAKVFMHPEIKDLLCYYTQYGFKYNFLIEKKRKHYVNLDYLRYELSKQSKSINIYPKFDDVIEGFDPNFGFEKKWNKDLDEINIYNYLTQEQIIAYNDWKKYIGIDKTKKLTRGLIHIK